MKLVSPRTIVGNRGDLLSRYGILEALDRHGAGPLTVFCHDAADLAGLDLPTAGNGRLFNLLPTRAGRRALAAADLVIWTGGLDLQDDSSLFKLAHMLLSFRSYRRRGQRVWVLMQGAGPLTTRAGRFLARRILGLVDRFLVRDSGSLRLLQGLGGSGLERCYDGIFLAGLDRLVATPAQAALVRPLTQRPARQPLVGLNIRLWFHFGNSILPYHLARRRYLARARAGMDRVVAAACQLTRRLRRDLGARVCLLSMYEPGTYPCEDDLPHLRRVKEAFADDGDVVLADGPLGLGGFCELVRGLDLMIGTRLHSTLAALRFGVPAINLAYTSKCGDIFGDLGLADRAIDLGTFLEQPGGVAWQAETMLANRGLPGVIRKKVAAVVAENERILGRAFRAEAQRLAA